MKRLLALRPSATPKKDLQQHVAEVVDSLNYDFHQFELNHFIEHISNWRAREIRYQGFPFTANLFGIWIPRDVRDYIAYNSNT